MFKTVRFFQIVAVVLVLALATPVLADSYKRSLTLSDATKLGGTEVKAGEYTLQFDGSKITLTRRNRVVAEATAEWADVESKGSANAVLTNSGEITEVRIEGKKRVIKVL